MSCSARTPGRRRPGGSEPTTDRLPRRACRPPPRCRPRARRRRPPFHHANSFHPGPACRIENPYGCVSDRTRRRAVWAPSHVPAPGWAVRDSIPGPSNDADSSATGRARCHLRDTLTYGRRTRRCCRAVLPPAASATGSSCHRSASGRPRARQRCGDPAYVREACDYSLARLGVVDDLYQHRSTRRCRSPSVPWPSWCGPARCATWAVRAGPDTIRRAHATHPTPRCRASG